MGWSIGLTTGNRVGLRYSNDSSGGGGSSYDNSPPSAAELEKLRVEMKANQDKIVAETLEHIATAKELHGIAGYDELQHARKICSVFNGCSSNGNSGFEPRIEALEALGLDEAEFRQIFDDKAMEASNETADLAMLAETSAEKIELLGKAKSYIAASQEFGVQSNEKYGQMVELSLQQANIALTDALNEKDPASRLNGVDRSIRFFNMATAEEAYAASDFDTANRDSYKAKALDRIGLSEEYLDGIVHEAVIDRYIQSVSDSVERDKTPDDLKIRSVQMQTLEDRAGITSENIAGLVDRGLNLAQVDKVRIEAYDWKVPEGMPGFDTKREIPLMTKIGDMFGM